MHLLIATGQMIFFKNKIYYTKVCPSLYRGYVFVLKCCLILQLYLHRVWPANKRPSEKYCTQCMWRGGGLQVPGTQLGTSQPFLSYFISGLKCLLLVLPGMAVPTYYCVLSVLIPLKVVCVILIFWVIAVKYPSLGCVRLQDGCWDRGRRPAVFSVCSERHNVQLSLWAVTILFNYVRF